MELLLNLIWLLLVVPAFWVWHGATFKGVGRKRRSGPCVLTLGCVLVLLFPVVSATDDLQAMRPEVEESAGRDALGNPHQERLLAQADGSWNAFALPVDLALARPEAVVWGKVDVTPSVLSAVNSVMTRVGRAPPLSFLG